MKGRESSIMKMFKRRVNKMNKFMDAEACYRDAVTAITD